MAGRQYILFGDTCEGDTAYAPVAAQQRTQETQLARVGLPAPLLGAPSLPELDSLRQIGEAWEDEFCRCCPRYECLASASDQTGLDARPKPSRAGATEITDK